MNQEDTQAIADAVAAKLQNPHMIPGIIPTDVGKWLRELTHGRPYTNIFTIPVGGQYNVPKLEVTILATGALVIRLSDVNGKHIWEGMLTPLDILPDTH